MDRQIKRRPIQIKMKTTLERVYEALNKVELKSEKIELGLLDDIKEEMKAANKGGIKAINLANDAKKPAEQSLKLNENLLKKIERTKKIAIELGDNKIVKDLQNKIKQVNENIKTLDDILSALYKI